MSIVKEEIEKSIQSLLALTEEEETRFTKLDEKNKSEAFEVAFCGHFSAGKSTILNALLGADILPTSPIPTSANIIAIANGDLALHVKTRAGEEKKWSGEIPWEQVRTWGMDGHDIAQITIFAPLPFLGKHSQILDTPGVDSTDDSHQAVTVEQLYTTDVIVYVMDYNHVQSETNLYFLKQLSQEKKPIYIVINQIDKHDETELSIEEFEQSIKDVFFKWDIHFVQLFFTTMKAPHHKLNGFVQFEKNIKGLLYNSKPLLPLSKERLYEGTVRAIEQRVIEEKQEKIDDILSIMKEKGYNPDQLSEREHIVSELEKVRTSEKAITISFEKEVEKVLADVTLFPYSTTDLTRQWLESMQSSFKVGLLFAKKKTEEERNLRLTRVVEELQQKVKTQLLFHIQKYFQELDKMKLSNKDEVEQAIANIGFKVTPQLFIERVKTEHTSRDYVFTFTKEITATIVRDIRQSCFHVITLYKEGLKEHWHEEETTLQNQLLRFVTVESYVDDIEQVKREYDELREKLAAILPVKATDFESEISEASKKTYPTDENLSFYQVDLPSDSVIDTSWEAEGPPKKQPIKLSDEWLIPLASSLAKNGDKDLLANERRQLIDRIERYQNQSFVISLFGAFSAGKSSFANALLGEAVLPVSPNPTTATVNTVQRSTEEHPNNTATVFVKSAEQLNAEIVAVAEQLDEKLTLTSIASWKPSTKAIESSWQKTYAEYLVTIQNTLAETSWELGSQFTISLDELKPVIAEERQACLVDSVDIYYDSPLTEKGIVLVDTPGVNSIHGRHTNVAFQQLRRSDAIFYVTYYNHAFSKADEYFLQQMAKVNESFSHDKLYFVINAADLASTERELNGVRKHVHDQLVRNGIEYPRLFHLSAKKGLEAKKANQQEDNWFSQFEYSFYHDTIHELKQLSLQMIELQVKQLVNKIADSLEFMNANKEKQMSRKLELKQQVNQRKLVVEQLSFSAAIHDITQELEQLLIYLRERMAYVLNDYYTSAINTATITGTSKKELQKKLADAIKEWKGNGEYFLKQELEANLIRLEEKIRSRSQQWLHEQIVAIQNDIPHVSCEESVTVPTLSLTASIQLLIDHTLYTTYVKSKKDFFENGVIRKLKEDIVADGKSKAGEVIDTVHPSIIEQVSQVSDTLEEQLKERIIIALDKELERFELLLDENEKQVLEEEYSALQEFIK
ncbi:dynamin family protein [Bacillus alkalicellulosilyticus]|uniref:dynamin family protein n=1 Tax=Alkalihalobacterium alkalicellulosilyticum TaxID=1912214 RepID=UPI00099653C9|nr:dynamin family protein [Bacillus alkalicellulosilyticus]